MPRPRSFSKPKRDFNDPVSPPAHSPAFIPAPPTNNVNLNLPLLQERYKYLTFYPEDDRGGSRVSLLGNGT